MKIKHSTKKSHGFTLVETTVGLGISSIVFAAAITASVGLQKSFNAIDNYFATHMQQIRIIDYLNRDVKRGLIVTTSADLQSVSITIPNYIIQAGDPEAVANPSLVGTPRTPTIAYSRSGPQVNYGSATSSVVYAISGQSILRTENGVITTIASSTDQLVPVTTDVDLTNTEYATTNVTFLPIFSGAEWNHRLRNVLSQKSATRLIGVFARGSTMEVGRKAAQAAQAAQAGNVLLCALCTILILSLIGGSVLLNSTTRFNVTSTQVRGWKEALQVAEAGGDIAYAEVRKTVLTPSNAFSGWTNSGTTHTSPVVTLGTNNLTTSSTVDVFYYDSITGSPWYRSRTKGVAPVRGLRRTGMDDRMLTGARGDSLLRKIDFNYDHFIATYGPNGDGIGKTLVSVSTPQIVRRIEQISAPITPFEAAIKCAGTFYGLGDAALIDSYDSRNGSYYFAATSPADAH